MNLMMKIPNREPDYISYFYKYWFDEAIRSSIADDLYIQKLKYDNGKVMVLFLHTTKEPVFTESQDVITAYHNWVSRTIDSILLDTQTDSK